MTLPDISFERIRPHEGSRDAGFEELCSQLAALEPASAGSLFHRKGRGGDAGVECYWEYLDGTETGWQAKYLFNWDASLKYQLDDSIRTALAKHPRLDAYIVCIPFDLSDARKGKAKSAKDKWNDWCARWEKAANAKGRQLKITLWGRSTLTAKLAKDSAATGGRVLYWFGDQPLAKGWLIDQFEKAKAALDERYTPETNIELPIRRNFLAFARDEELQRQLDRWFIKFSEGGRRASESIGRIAKDAAQAHSGSLNAATSVLVGLLGAPAVGPEGKFPLSEWTDALAQCKKAAFSAFDWLRSLPDANDSRSASEPVNRANHDVFRFLESLRDFEEELGSRRWQLANAAAVLLTGPAGIGKSHLLADVVEHQVHLGRPAILVLGSSFRDDDPWRQILGQVDRPATEQIKHFLGCLDSAAEATRARALVCVDALNERNGMDIWPNWLATFLKVAEAFPRVGIVLSCRTTYVPYIVPSGLIPSKLIIIEHSGFAVDGGKAAKAYLDKRGIIRPGAPNLAPEINNPLFLKTCCDLLKKEGRTEFPRGLRGVTSIFRFYSEAVVRTLNQRLRLDPHFGIVSKAISTLAKCLAHDGSGYLEKAKVIDLFEAIFVSGGKLETSLLAQLESEGMLSIEPMPQTEGSIIEMVRFTFERFSDHAIAERLLTDHLNLDDVQVSFSPGSPLHEFVFGEDNFRRAGVIEAIAIQLPEKSVMELPDTADDDDWVVRNAFKESFLWREQSHFTSRTFELAQELLQPEELNDLLISVSSEPENRYNARFLSPFLKKLSLPERDEHWSIYLAHNGMSDSVETLISWAIASGMDHIDAERAYLAALMLTWLLTTTNREVRDRATKGLACLLARRLGLAARLIEEFADVDDPYVLERLITACYGAALQGEGKELIVLSSAVYAAVFGSGKPPVDALMRESAHGILLYAEWRGLLSGDVDLAKAAPPYESSWPIEYVPDILIETYQYKRPRGTFSDSIVHSVVHDGDFARYQMDDKICKWSPAPLGTAEPPTNDDVAAQWYAEFVAIASTVQREAFNSFVDAVRALNSDALYTYERTPEKDHVEAAEVALKATLTSDEWEDFRVRARDYSLWRDKDAWSTERPAVFDRQWARRWVCKRAHDLGWTSECFVNFDEFEGRHGRQDHHVERIGKKYQWIALRELIARMADNLVYLGDSFGNHDTVSAYKGAREIGLRDIDPSLLTTKTHYDGWAEWGPTWWVPFRPVLRNATPHERLAWLHSDSDIINDASLIDVRDPKTARRYLALRGFSSWKGRGVCDGREEYQRETWFRIQSVVVHKSDELRLIDALKGKILTDPHSLPVIRLNDDFYLGEYPWHPEMKDVDDWIEPGRSWRSVPVPTRATVAEYSCESGGYDFSVDATVVVEMPAPWLAQSMRLRMKNGKSPTYVNRGGEEMFFDPSVHMAGPSGALVNREAFLKMLECEGLSCVWVIAGEKSVYGGGVASRGFGGRLLHTGIYSLSQDGLVREFHKAWQKPSPEQLKELYGSAKLSGAIPSPEKSSSGKMRTKKDKALRKNYE